MAVAHRSRHGLQIRAIGLQIRAIGLIEEAGITAELMEYKHENNSFKLSYPIFQRGIKYSFEIKACAEWNGYKYEHIFDKIEGEYEWKK